MTADNDTIPISEADMERTLLALQDAHNWLIFTWRSECASDGCGHGPCDAIRQCNAVLDRLGQLVDRAARTR